jgi:hypothetical protein
VYNGIVMSNIIDQPTTISIKTRKSVKRKAMARAQEIGIPLGTIINSYILTFAETGRLSLISPKMMNSAEDDLYGPFDIDSAIDFLDSNSAQSLSL